MLDILGQRHRAQRLPTEMATLRAWLIRRAAAGAQYGGRWHTAVFSAFRYPQVPHVQYIT